MKAKAVMSKGNLNTRDKITAMNGKENSKPGKLKGPGTAKPTMKKPC